MIIYYNTRLVYLCILYLVFITIRAQNLIPDSSFESNKFIPIDFSGIGASKTWSRPSLGTSDLFCECNKKQKKISLVDVPQNPMGFQDAHSGTCYAGIFAYSHGSYREYLLTGLTEPLKKNTTYVFSMYISLADYSKTYIDQIGICFLDKTVNYNSANVITDLKPVYINIKDIPGKEEKLWHKVSVSYKAKGGETFLLIGSFNVQKVQKTKFKFPKEIRTRINQKAERDAYYFIDDVSLIETDYVETIDTSVVALPLNTDSISSHQKFILKNVTFETNKALILPSSYEELDRMADYLIKNPLLKIEISGHTDNSGNEKANKKLSLARARSVSDYLIKKNINKNRLRSVGCGSSNPIVSNATEEGKQQNRRVEFSILTE